MLKARLSLKNVGRLTEEWQDPSKVKSEGSSFSVLRRRRSGEWKGASLACATNKQRARQTHPVTSRERKFSRNDVNACRRAVDGIGRSKTNCPVGSSVSSTKGTRTVLLCVRVFRFSGCVQPTIITGDIRAPSNRRLCLTGTQFSLHLATHPPMKRLLFCPVCSITDTPGSADA